MGRAIQRLWRRLLAKVPRASVFSRGAGALDIRGLAAPGVAFHLRSEAVRPDTAEGEDIISFHNAARRRFESGILFADLGSAAMGGALICARIEATTGKGPGHVISVYPKC